MQFLDRALPPRLLDDLADSGRIVDWAGQARFERALLRSGLADRLAANGCVALCLGMESGSATGLARLEKGGITDAGERATILHRLADAGIRTHLFVITGFPGETEDEFEETVDFLAKNEDVIDSIEINAFQLQAGTKLAADPEAWGIRPKRHPGAWSLADLYDGAPGPIEAAARARALAEGFAHMLARSRINDLLEGHMALVGRLELLESRESGQWKS